MSSRKRCFLLYGMFAQRQPQIFKTKAAVDRHLLKYPNLTFQEFTNEIDAEIAMKHKVKQYESAMRELKMITRKSFQRAVMGGEEKEKIGARRRAVGREEEEGVGEGRSSSQNKTKPLRISDLTQLPSISSQHKPKSLQDLQHLLQSPIYKYFQPTLLKLPLPSTPISLYFDGSCKGNPGHQGIGYQAVTNELLYFSQSRYCGLGTNNEAEFKALCWAMMDCALKRVKHVEFYGDSQLVVFGMQRKYKIQHPTLARCMDVCLALERQFEGVGYCQVNREGNRRADGLAKKGADKWMEFIQ